MRRSAARLCTILMCITGLPMLTAVPAAAAPGFAVRITELPGTFAAGAQPELVTVVAATQRTGSQCLKVRWSLVMQVEDLDIDQVRVDRVEDTGAFPLSVRTDGDRARLTDVQLDPGTLCPDRTVSARYRISFSDEVETGRVSLLAEAYDANEQLLERATATRQVVAADDRVQPSPSQSEDGADSPVGESAPLPTDPPTGGDSPAASADAERTSNSLPLRPVNTGADPALLVGVVVGAVLIFLGVGLLLRLRRKANAGPDGGRRGARLAPYRRRRYS